MRTGALVAAAAATALALGSGCAKIFGIDDPGVLSDGGLLDPCSNSNNNATQCGSGLLCVSVTGGNNTMNICVEPCDEAGTCPSGTSCGIANVMSMTMGGSASVCLPGSGGGSSSGGSSGGGSGSGSGGGSGSSSGGGDGNAGLAPMPMPRTQTACALGADNKVYVFGGMDESGGARNEVQIYDPSSNSWSTGPNMLTARYAAGIGAGQPGGPFFVVGGFGNGGVPSNAMEQFGLGGGGSWSADSPMPMALGASAVSGIGQIYVAGGATSPNGAPVGRLQDWQLPGQWSSQNLPSLPTPRRYMAAASPQGALLTVGGFDSSGAASNAVETFIGTTWMIGSPMPTKRGKLAAAGGPNDIVYVVGGANGGAVGDFASYQAASSTWTPLTDMPTPRAGLCAVFVSGGSAPGRVYAIGGEEEITPAKVYGVVEAYDLVKGAWIR